MFPDPSSILRYIRRRWFHLLLVGLMLFVLLRKDLSFQVQLNSPRPGEDVSPAEAVEPEQYSATGYTPPMEVEAQKLGLSSSPLPALDLLEAVKAISPTELKEFLDRFARVAKAEEKKFGIPASLTLAHALLASKAGQSIIAREANNFFVLPCTSDWEGPTARYDGSCLRKYPNAWTSFRDHSLFLTTGPQNDLKKLAGKSSDRWIKALEGRALSKQIPHYGEQVAACIQVFELGRY